MNSNFRAKNFGLQEQRNLKGTKLKRLSIYGCEILQGGESLRPRGFEFNVSDIVGTFCCICYSSRVFETVFKHQRGLSRSHDRHESKCVFARAFKIIVYRLRHFRAVFESALDGSELDSFRKKTIRISVYIYIYLQGFRKRSSARRRESSTVKNNIFFFHPPIPIYI